MGLALEFLLFQAKKPDGLLRARLKGADKEIYPYLFDEINAPFGFSAAS
jgi:hypothetical protein